MERFNAYDGNKPFVFVSYAHLDRATVYPIIDKLHSEGYRIWYDEGIEVSASYKAVINENIEKCAVFAVFVTKNGIVRPEVVDECTYAIALRKKIVFICIEETDPTHIPAALRATFTTKQQLLWYKWSETERSRKLRDSLLPCMETPDNYIKRPLTIVPPKNYNAEPITGTTISQPKERRWCYIVSFGCTVITLLLQPAIFQLNRHFSLSENDFEKLMIYFYSGLLVSIIGFIFSRIPLKQCNSKTRKICRIAGMTNWYAIVISLFVYFVLSLVFPIYNDL